MTRHDVVMLIADIAGVAFWLVWAAIANKMAWRRGRSTKAWVWLAVIFGPFAIFVLKFLPPKQDAQVMHPTA
jgi:hypothetical protein